MKRFKALQLSGESCFSQKQITKLPSNVESCCHILNLKRKDTI